MILGTSMSENFKCSEFDELTGGYSQKLTLSGGHISEIAFTAEYALKHQNIRTVLLDITTRSFILPGSRFKLQRGLYEDSIPLPDRISNMLSLETMVRNLNNLSKSTSFDRDKNYSWSSLAPCGMKHFSKYMIEKEDVWQKSVLDLKKYNASEVQELIDKYLVALVCKHPEVTFYIYFPPYSAIEFSFDPQIYADFRKIIMDALLHFDNVKLYDFQAAKEIICDFNNYKDTLHYSEEINSWIIYQLNSDKFLVTAENRYDFERKFNDLMRKFDKEKAFDELRQYYKEHSK